MVICLKFVFVIDVSFIRKGVIIVLFIILFFNVFKIYLFLYINILFGYLFYEVCMVFKIYLLSSLVVFERSLD